MYQANDRKEHKETFKQQYIRSNQPKEKEKEKDPVQTPVPVPQGSQGRRMRKVSQYKKVRNKKQREQYLKDLLGSL